VTLSVIAAVPWAELALFLWVLANQGGVPIPVVPALLGAGALAGSGGSLSGVVTLAVSIAAALCADLTWYLLGRWRGSRALDLSPVWCPRRGPTFSAPRISDLLTDSCFSSSPGSSPS